MIRARRRANSKGARDKGVLKFSIIDPLLTAGKTHGTYHGTYRGVAQSGSALGWGQVAGGSNPLTPTKIQGLSVFRIVGFLATWI